MCKFSQVEYLFQHSPFFLADIFIRFVKPLLDKPSIQHIFVYFVGGNRIFVIPNVVEGDVEKYRPLAFHLTSRIVYQKKA